MTRFPALEGLRIGCVQYLNSRPLIHFLHLPLQETPGGPGLYLAHPSTLAAKLQEGTLDAALVPVFEALRNPAHYRLVQGVAIASHGPVYSVYVAHSRPLEDIQAVLADPASLTSVHLFQVLAAGSLRRRVPLLDPRQPTPISATTAPTGQLLIGNQALEFRLRHLADGMQFWDLGQAWTEWTALPFVYAVWLLRRDLHNAETVAQAFRDAGTLGVASAAQIAAEQTDFPRELALRYLTTNIRYGLGPEERAGLERFALELERGGHLPPGPAPTGVRVTPRAVTDHSWFVQSAGPWPAASEDGPPVGMFGALRM